jgi:hypothetical protein
VLCNIRTTSVVVYLRHHLLKYVTAHKQFFFVCRFHLLPLPDSGFVEDLLLHFCKHAFIGDLKIGKDKEVQGGGLGVREILAYDVIEGLSKQMDRDLLVFRNLC